MSVEKHYLIYCRDCPATVLGTGMVLLLWSDRAKHERERLCESRKGCGGLGSRHCVVTQEMTQTQDKILRGNILMQ